MKSISNLFDIYFDRQTIINYLKINIKKAPRAESESSFCHALILSKQLLDTSALVINTQSIEG